MSVVLQPAIDAEAAPGPAALAPTAPEMRPHRRQFIAGPEPLRPYSDWICRQVGELWLSHCPALPVAVARDAQGQQWAVLGRALQTVPGAPDPAEQIPHLTSQELCDAQAGWAGRWTLLGRGEIHPDGGALLGVFYGRSDDGRGWASSSPALMRQILFADNEAPPPRRRLLYEVGLTWFPPPTSAWTKMLRLLPSQTLEVASGLVRARALMPALKSEPDYEASLAAVRDSMISALRSLARQAPGPAWVSLSAGFDSRVTLAMVLASGIKAQIFTRITPRTPLADRRLPPQLAAAAGLAHHFTQGGPLIESRRVACLAHTAGHVSEGDADPLLRGARDALEGTLLGGWCIESGNGFLKRPQVPPDLTEPGAFFFAVLAAVGEKPGSEAAGELRQWLDWVVAHPQGGLSLRDRLHVEQRIAGWMSSKEQLNDLAGTQRISIFNCARNYATLLALPDELRRGKRYGRDLVQLAAPELARFPFNPPERQFGWAAAAAHRFRHPLVACARVARSARQRLRRLGAAPLM